MQFPVEYFKADRGYEMSFWSKFFDLGLTGDWEEYQRIQLYRKKRKKLDKMSIKEIKDRMK